MRNPSITIEARGAIEIANLNRPDRLNAMNGPVHRYHGDGAVLFFRDQNRA